MVIIYDFDGTLTPFSVPKYKIFENIGMNNDEWINKAYTMSKNLNTDLYTELYKIYFDIVNSHNIKLDDKNITLGSTDVIYNKGVLEYFDNISKYNIKNYLVSSGIKTYLENTKISKYFIDIYATTFNYKENIATSTKYILSDKGKVDAIKDIISKNKDSNIIYIGDGLTDYYAFKYVNSINGKTIFICKSDTNQTILDKLKHENIISLYTKNDYSLDSELYKYIMSNI